MRRASPSIVGEDAGHGRPHLPFGTLLGPGRVKHPGAGMTYIGELDGTATPRLAGGRHGAPRRRHRGDASPPRILDEVWKKLALNVCTLPTAALLASSPHELVSIDGTHALMAAILGEVVGVASAQGIALD